MLRFPPACAVLLGAVLGTAATAEESTIYTGCCDASAAVVISETHFIVADDEDNILRVYARVGGDPVMQFDLGPHLRLKKKSEEADLEAAARVGDIVFWLGSHGRNAKGKETVARQKIVATRVDTRGGSIEIIPLGEPYSQLLDDLVSDDRLRDYDLAAAAALAPKAKGGLNIEGLTATPDGSLLIGFRNPVPEGKALLIPLLNPRQLFEGERAKFGDPIRLDLGGYGIRSLAYHGDRHLIIAGHFDQGGKSRLYSWKGAGAPAIHLETVKLAGLNPEALGFASKDGKNEFLVLSDDGSRPVGDIDCKQLKDPNQKRFRGVVIEVRPSP